jgi:hypothetical protein
VPTGPGGQTGHVGQIFNSCKLKIEQNNLVIVSRNYYVCFYFVLIIFSLSSTLFRKYQKYASSGI